MNEFATFKHSKQFYYIGQVGSDLGSGQPRIFPLVWTGEAKEQFSSSQ
jgi:hypothetical protein